MGPVTADNYFDAARGLYWYCVDYHGGQFSDLYRIQCQLQYQPSPSENGADEHDESGEFYAALVAGDIDAQETLNAIQEFSK